MGPGAPPGEGWSRVYFGADCCQTLLPTVAVLRSARAQVPSGAAFTLLTPAVDDAGLAHVAALLRELHAGDEVTVADYGVLGLVRERTGLVPVLGTLLTRMLRDPRIPPAAGAFPPATDADRVLRQASVTSPAFRSLLTALGVRRVELAPVAQGFDMDFAAMELTPTLHAPFAPVTGGRVCLFAAMGQAPEHRFEVGAGCHQECRRYVAATTDADGSMPHARLFTAGNTVFQEHPRDVVARSVAALDVRGARLVVRDAPLAPWAWSTEERSVARRWLDGTA